MDYLGRLFKPGDKMQKINPYTELSMDEGLKMYALSSQAQWGDNHTPKPYMLNVQGRMMWNAWTQEKGKTKLEATNEFIILASRLLKEHKVKYKLPTAHLEEYEQCLINL